MASVTGNERLPIVKPVRVDVRSAWPSEPYDFTPWLAENLDLLDTLEIGPLQMVGTEVSVADTGRALDLLAELGDGRLVAIENQFGRADHDHLTRGLAYAVGLTTPEQQVAALVVIAEDHGPEFVAIADYLNSAAEQLGPGGIAVFLVRVSVERVGDSLVPRLEVLSRPNQWRTDLASSGRLQSVQDFFDMLEPSYQATVSELLAVWETRTDASLGHKAQRAVALYTPNPAIRSGRTALYLIQADGTLVINVGYIIDSGLLPDEQQALRFRGLVIEQFPDVATGPKEYYYSTQSWALEAVITVADWVDQHTGRF